MCEFKGVGTYIRMLLPRLLRAKAVAGVPKLGGGPPVAPTLVNWPPTPTGVAAGVLLPPANASLPGLMPPCGPPE